MSHAEIKRRFPLIWQVFFAEPEGKPQRKDYPSAWEHARALLKWKANDDTN